MQTHKCESTNYLIGLLGIFTIALFSCQPLTLKGKVYSSDMKPIATATIWLKRTGENVISTTAGEFMLNRIRIQDTLMISAPGFISEELPLDPYIRGEIKVLLKHLD